MQAYRKEHDGDGQCDGCEDGDPHAQDQRVVRVDPAVGVQQFGFHAVCRDEGRTKRQLDDRRKMLFTSVTSRRSCGCICW